MRGALFRSGSKEWDPRPIFSTTYVTRASSTLIPPMRALYATPTPHMLLLAYRRCNSESESVWLEAHRIQAAKKPEPLHSHCDAQPRILLSARKTNVFVVREHTRKRPRYA